MDGFPFVSVIVPVYNVGDYLEHFGIPRPSPIAHSRSSATNRLTGI